MTAKKNKLPRTQGRPLGSDELSDLNEQFSECDTDDDGSIDFTEFSQLLGNLNSTLPPEKRRAQFDEIDSARDGVISQMEFVQWWRGR